MQKSQKILSVRGVWEHSNQVRVWEGIKSSEFFNVSYVYAWKYGSSTHTFILLCSCTQFIAMNEEKKPAISTSSISSIFTSEKIQKQNASLMGNTGSSPTPAVMLGSSSRSAVMLSKPTSTVDGRVNNRGSSQRTRYTVRQKINFIEEVEKTMEEHGLKYPVQVFSEIRKDCPMSAKKFTHSYNQWTKEDTYRALLLSCTQNKCSHEFKKLCTSKAQSPFHEIESQLYLIVTDKRKQAHRVSYTFMRLTALKLFGDCKREDPERWNEVSFKASFGWLRRFIARRDLKYRKRRSGKEHTVAELLPAYKQFLANLRFNFIVPKEPGHVRDPLWGRFPPHLRYNFDQVPLPFVVEQDYTFTTNDDTHPHIRAPSETLRKRQFTMHIVTNAGEGDKAHGWVDLVCKGKGTRVHLAEKELWDGRVSVNWQKNAWVDNDVMESLAHRFVRKKIEMHGEDIWVIAFCDNLKAHVNERVRDIFGKGHVFLCFFPPNMTHIVQPIDAGIGRSLRVAIGHALDKWLMDGENMMKWEGKMTAGERRILITQLVGESMDYIMAPDQDKLRIGAFERTGCLITMAVSEELDKKIKPQGISPGSFEVPTDASLLNDSFDHPQVPQPEEDELIAARQVQELIDEENSELDDITDSVE